MQWFDFIADRLDRLPALGLNGWLTVWRFVIAAGAAVLGVLLVRRKCRRPLAVAALALCVLCYAGEWRINRWTYAIPAETAARASALNDALQSLDGTVLFLPNGIRQRDSQLIETYISRDFYIVEYETLQASGPAGRRRAGPDCRGRRSRVPGPPLHRPDCQADWLLVADGVPVDTAALEYSGIPCPDGYTLYRNPTPGLVAFLV